MTSATLDFAAGRAIWRGDNVPSWSWFVDPARHDGSKFTTPGSPSEHPWMDLRTVQEYEVGALFDWDRLPDGMMTPTLCAGMLAVKSHGPDADTSELGRDTLFAMLAANAPPAWDGAL
jgi:hypothetical protein